MIGHLSILRTRDFINKERIYFLMLAFILLLNAWIIFAQKIPGIKESFAGRKVLESRLIEKVEDEDRFIPLLNEKISWDEILEKQRHIPVLINVLSSMVALVFSLGLFLDIRILMARVKKRAIFKTAGRHLKVKWGIFDIFKLVIIFVFLGYILHIIEQQIFSSSLLKEGTDRPISLLNAGIMDLLILGFIVYFVKVKYSQGLAALGLKIKGWARGVFLAILSYIAFLPLLAFLLLVVIMLAAIFNYHPPQQALFKLFLQEKNIWFLIYSTTMVVILGPIVEEVFFRGFTYNAIKRRWGKRTAMVLTAVVFAWLHGNLIGFLPIMALGFLLVYVYEKTGSLIPSIAIHILHNGIMVGLLFLTRYLVQMIASG